MKKKLGLKIGVCHCLLYSTAFCISTISFQKRQQKGKNFKLFHFVYPVSCWPRFKESYSGVKHIREWTSGSVLCCHLCVSLHILSYFFSYLLSFSLNALRFSCGALKICWWEWWCGAWVGVKHWDVNCLEGKKKGYLKVSAHSLGYEWFMLKLVLWRKNNATQTEEIVSFLSMEMSLAGCILLNLVLSSCNRGEQAKTVRYKKGKSSTAFFFLCILPQKQMNGFLHWLEDIEGNWFFMH